MILHPRNFSFQWMSQFHENSPFFPKKPTASEDEPSEFFSLPSLDLDPTPSTELSPQVKDTFLPQSQNLKERFAQVYSRRNKAPSSHHDLELDDTRNASTVSVPSSSINDNTNLDLDFMHDPRDPYLLAVYRILHYLKSCPGKGMLFKRGNKLTIEAFTDADYASSVSDKRSTSGYYVLIGGSLVSC
ncbi:hypothetical protein V2J09_022715 [Rumex salicifolius]